MRVASPTVRGDEPRTRRADASRSLSNSRQILLRNSAHGYASDCVKGIIAQFIAKGSAQELDVACAERKTSAPVLACSSAAPER